MKHTMAEMRKGKANAIPVGGITGQLGSRALYNLALTTLTLCSVETDGKVIMNGMKRSVKSRSSLICSTILAFLRRLRTTVVTCMYV
jgi:hypothetical protein